MRFLIAVIVVICICALAATITAIVVGKQSFEGVVVVKPYETGLAWDETLRNKATLGWNVALQTTHFKTGKNDLVFSVRDKSGNPLAHALVKVTISRPSTGIYDKTYPAVILPDGRYTAMIDLPVYGTWTAIVDVRRTNDHADYEYAIEAAQDGK
jgi:nitrogen fixation protein FixH